MSEACRTTQHCAYHGWCHRCHEQFAGLMSEINMIIQSSKAPPESWGELYGRIGKALHGDEKDRDTVDLATARATNQRLNHRAQAAEAKLSAVERAVGEWKIEEGSVFLPMASLVAIAQSTGRIMEVGRLVSYSEKIEELQAEVNRLEAEKEEEKKR